ncbi:MAG TPA: ABC transporter ATP-binding protein [Burkholderiales bacterium]|nr:ABC transporter ATP-binding protein [Burkholderiales bacterium]
MKPTDATPGTSPATAADAVPALRFSSVSKAFGQVPALADFSLDIAPGELFGLVGVNGAGKTTLIKCLLDFCAADAGTIDIFGTPHSRTRARAPLVFLPERFNPPHFLTGRDFVQYMLTLHGRSFDPGRAAHMLTALDLDPAALKRPVRAYSKGMTQKLGLAACLLCDKALYVLDEPTSGLDPKARALLKAQFRALKARGATLFFTSHALADVDEICNRMAVLHDGRVRFAGPPDELCRQFEAPDLEQAFLHCIDDRSGQTVNNPPLLAK